MLQTLVKPPMSSLSDSSENKDTNDIKGHKKSERLNSDEQLAEQSYEFRSGSHDFENRMHKFNMTFLRALAKPILPAGYWSKNRYTRHDEKTPINLTFDDGPNPATTRELLVVLEDEKVKGTFFFIGENIRLYPELVEAVHKAGHIIGNHSMTHTFLPNLTRKAVEKEIDQTNQLITDIVGAGPTLFRAPYGIMDKRCAEALKERRMSTVYWGAMADDFRPIGEDAVVSRIMKQIPGNELVVLHEGRHPSQCIKSTREIIKRSKDLGFTFEPIQ